MNYLELEEEYNQDGVCIRRAINGQTLPNDEHPSVEFLGEDIKNSKWVKQKFFLTNEEARQRYGFVAPTTTDNQPINSIRKEK